MTMTPREFAPIWQRMLRAWPATTPVEGTAREYADRLAVFTPGEVTAAVERLILTAEWFPPIAAVWQLCLDGRDRAPTWPAAFQEAQQHAAGTALPWSHTTVEQAYHAIGGWNIRTQPAGEVAARAQFRDTYQQLLAERQAEYAAGVRPLPPAPHAAIEAGDRA